MSNIWVELKATDEHLLDYLRKEDGIFDNLFETILAKDKLVEIDNILSKIVGGVRKRKKENM